MAMGGIELQRAKLPGILNDLECQLGALQRWAGPETPGLPTLSSSGPLVDSQAWTSAVGTDGSS